MKKVHLFDDDFCTRLLETTGDSDVKLKEGIEDEASEDVIHEDIEDSVKSLSRLVPPIIHKPCLL